MTAGTVAHPQELTSGMTPKENLRGAMLRCDEHTDHG
jgi:hypothetical protein